MKNLPKLKAEYNVKYLNENGLPDVYQLNGENDDEAKNEFDAFVQVKRNLGCRNFFLIKKIPEIIFSAK